MTLEYLRFNKSLDHKAMTDWPVKNELFSPKAPYLTAAILSPRETSFPTYIMVNKAAPWNNFFPTDRKKK